MDEKQCNLPECNPTEDEIRGILSKCKKIAVVGLSPKEERDSHKVAKYLLEQGYDIVPVNPGQREILGKKCYKNLREIPFPVDLVDLFLNPVRVPPIIDEAIDIGAGVIWMQIGVIHKEAAEKATKKGIQVVMDRCMKQEHENLKMNIEASP
jgi:predicted CoA-binding protein